jgi:hypothetical protein
MNRAADLHWNNLCEHVPVHFRATTLKGSIASGYKFTDVDSN